ESRPTGSAMGDYFFSMDLEGHIDEPRVAAALSGVHRISPNIRFLGSYRAPTASLSRCPWMSRRPPSQRLRRGWTRCAVTDGPLGSVQLLGDDTVDGQRAVVHRCADSDDLTDGVAVYLKLP